jgi:flagellar assembly factor FliW
MKLQTKFEEIVEVNESDILRFEQGLPGFEEEKQFVLMAIEGTPFSILQSVTTTELAFITADPFVFFKDYDFELSPSDQEQLKVKKPEEVSVQVIVTVADHFEKSTANLKGPVIINYKKNIGKQVVLNEVKYNTRHYIEQEG